MTIIKNRTPYWPYFATLRYSMNTKRHKFKDPILLDVDWYLQYVYTIDDRELLKIGEFQHHERTGVIAFYGENVLDSYFRSEARNGGDSPDFVPKLRAIIEHLKLFFTVLAWHEPCVWMSAKEIKGAQEAVKFLEAWEAKSDEEVQAWASGVIDKEGWGTRVFI